jgi:hypothetical protein
MERDRVMEFIPGPKIRAFTMGNGKYQIQIQIQIENIIH